MLTRRPHSFKIIPTHRGGSSVTLGTVHPVQLPVQRKWTARLLLTNEQLCDNDQLYPRLSFLTAPQMLKVLREGRERNHIHAMPTAPP